MDNLKISYNQKGPRSLVSYRRCPNGPSFFGGRCQDQGIGHMYTHLQSMHEKKTLDMIVTRRNDRMDKSEHQFNQFNKKQNPPGYIIINAFYYQVCPIVDILKQFWCYPWFEDKPSSEVNTTDLSIATSLKRLNVKFSKEITGIMDIRSG